MDNFMDCNLQMTEESAVQIKSFKTLIFANLIAVDFAPESCVYKREICQPSGQIHFRTASGQIEYHGS